MIKLNEWCIGEHDFLFIALFILCADVLMHANEKKVILLG